MERPSNVKSEASRDILQSSSSRRPSHEVPSMMSNSDTPGPGPSTQSCNSSNDSESGSDGVVVNDNNTSTEESIDNESIKGIFGWETLDNTSIPYLLRRGKKYVSIRIVERKLLSKYPNASPDELGKKDPLVSHFITEAEANLLNEINISHCDYEYGETPFTDKDLVVDLEEFDDFFKIVKKTFPEEILASIKGEVPTSPQPVETPPSTDPSQCCGWIQVNNTVSPYIIRGNGQGKDQVKLIPLSVIVYAAGLLTNANVKGLLPTSHECRMLNAACKAAGFDFTFGRSTRLIAISEVVQRCQVQLFELPYVNPLQHAHYLDHRTATTVPSVHNPGLRQPPPPPYSIRGGSINPPMPLESMGGQPAASMNPFHPRFPGLDPSSSLRPGGMMPPGMSFDPRQMLPDKKLSNLDPSQFPTSIQQALLDKCNVNVSAMNTMTMVPPNVRLPLWPMNPGYPPPAHSGKPGMSSKTPPSRFNGPLPSSSSSPYHSLSLPPNPLLLPNPLDMNHSIYRMPGLPTSKDNHIMHNPAISNQRPLGPQLSSQHQPVSYHHSHQFSSSLFACGDSKEPKKSTNQPPSVITSTHRNSTSLTTSKPHNFNPSHSNSMSHSNNSNPDLVRCISACLVNGKSISCLDVDSISRKGKFCLVEAVSKLYFPTVPIAEFLKVLQVVLRANLYPCTPEEETAFVQYYNLPAPRLKCNQMIVVEDLKRYFPQLTYIFSRRTAGHVSPEESKEDRGLKRTTDMIPQGPPLKQAVLEDVVAKMNSAQKQLAGNNAGTSNGGSKASIIVIDD